MSCHTQNAPVSNVHRSSHSLIRMSQGYTLQAIGDTPDLKYTEGLHSLSLSKMQPCHMIQTQMISRILCMLREWKTLTVYTGTRSLLERKLEQNQPLFCKDHINFKTNLLDMLVVRILVCKLVMLVDSARMLYYRLANLPYSSHIFCRSLVHKSPWYTLLHNQTRKHNILHIHFCVQCMHLYTFVNWTAT